MLKHDIPELDKKGLQRFGLMMAGFIAGVFGMVLPWVWEWPYPVWPWVVGAPLLVWALIAPASMRPLYTGWMHVAMTIGSIITHVVLAVVFFLVLCPTGLVMRMAGRDPMARRIDKSRKTYRIKPREGERIHMERPF